MEFTLTCGTTWSLHFAPQNRLEYNGNTQLRREERNWKCVSFLEGW